MVKAGSRFCSHVCHARYITHPLASFLCSAGSQLEARQPRPQRQRDLHKLYRQSQPPAELLRPSRRALLQHDVGLRVLAVLCAASFGVAGTLEATSASVLAVLWAASFDNAGALEATSASVLAVPSIARCHPWMRRPWPALSTEITALHYSSSQFYFWPGASSAVSETCVWRG